MILADQYWYIPAAMAIFVLVPVAYFMPTLVALGKRNAFAIFILNLVAGWTFIGWVVAMVWACTDDKRL